MTNYNEKLDKILSNFRQSSLIINANNSLGAGYLSLLMQELDL